MRNFLTWCSKYLSILTILIIGVICYILFFQENSVINLYDINRQIDSLERAIKIEKDTMVFYQEKNQRLDNHDPEMVEKVVREQHNMSMPTEDIYIFKDTTP